MVDVPATIEAELLGDKTFDASDPKAVNESRKRAGRQKRNQLDFVKAMMDLQQGRKYVYDLMESCSIFGNPITQNDPYATYYQLGRQSVGKQLLTDVMNFPEKYILMMKENK